MTYIVKFSPCNKRTLKLIEQQKIRFSTSYKLNDFNELRYMVLDGQEKICLEGFLGNFKKDLFFKQMKENSPYTIDHLATMENECIINAGEFKKVYYAEILENLVYNSVGIFSASCINVFFDDSAQLMFAHYARNCQGIALIYHISEINKLHQIVYSDENPLADQNNVHPAEWLNSIFTNVGCFKKKSKKWGYENEYRLFGKPGLHFAAKHGLGLKAILYTSRLQDGKLQELKNAIEALNNKMKINKMYKEVILQEIIPQRSRNYTRFSIEKYDGNIAEWIINTLSST
jgi:Protein of unknown function (DUF2971)